MVSRYDTQSKQRIWVPSPQVLQNRAIINTSKILFLPYYMRLILMVMIIMRMRMRMRMTLTKTVSQVSASSSTHSTGS